MRSLDLTLRLIMTRGIKEEEFDLKQVKEFKEIMYELELMLDLSWRATEDKFKNIPALEQVRGLTLAQAQSWHVTAEELKLKQKWERVQELTRQWREALNLRPVQAQALQALEQAVGDAQERERERERRRVTEQAFKLELMHKLVGQTKALMQSPPKDLSC